MELKPVYVLAGVGVVAVLWWLWSQRRSGGNTITVGGNLSGGVNIGVLAPPASPAFPAAGNSQAYFTCLGRARQQHIGTHREAAWRELALQECASLSRDCRKDAAFYADLAQIDPWFVTVA